MAALLVLLAWIGVPASVAGGGAPVCPTPPGDSVSVAVVVDFEDVDPVPDEPHAMCVTAPRGTDAAAVLEARARQLSTPPPRYNSAGLLCAIDGLPEDGCGERTAEGYRYWSYWQGSASGWEYAVVGPAQRVAEPNVVEGWHFVEGAGRPVDPPPRMAVGAVQQAALERGAVGETAAPSSGSVSWGPVAGAGGVLVLVGAGVVASRRRARAGHSA